jgi:hypothetical protein
MAEREVNGDTRVILHRLDQQDAQITRILSRQERWQELSEKRLNLCEKQVALIEQSNRAICQDVQGIKDKQEKNDLWTKIIGGATGLLTVVLTYLGLRGQ